jgi:hypothetical protein
MFNALFNLFAIGLLGFAVLIVLADKWYKEEKEKEKREH